MIFQYYSFGVPYALVSLSCIGIYAAYTFSVTAWRTKFRMQMNATDQKLGNRAVDSLINYETVKVSTWYCTISVLVLNFFKPNDW